MMWMKHGAMINLKKAGWKKILFNAEQCIQAVYKFQPKNWCPGINITQIILFLYEFTGLQCIKYRAVNEDAVKKEAMINLKKEEVKILLNTEQCDLST